MKIAAESLYSRVLAVSEYYRFILTSRLMFPPFAMRELGPETKISRLLQNLGAHTVEAITNYSFDLQPNRAEALRATLLAMVSVTQSRGENVGGLDANYEKFCEVRPDEPLLTYDFAMLYLNVGEVERAVGILDDLLQSFPECGVAHAALALIFTINEDWRRGLKHAGMATRLGAEIRPQLVDLCLSSCSFKLGGEILGAFDFSALLKDGGECVELLRKLPPVENQKTVSRERLKPVLFVYSDERYFYEHVIALICSLHETGSSWDVHLHLCNPSPKALRDLLRVQQRVAPLRITYSTERVALVRFGEPFLYHSCVRFCRMYQFFVDNSVPLVMVDADTLFNRNPDLLVGIAILVSPSDSRRRLASHFGRRFGPGSVSLNRPKLRGNFSRDWRNLWRKICYQGKGIGFWIKWG